MKTITCTSCKTQEVLYYPDNVLIYVCGHCQTVLEQSPDGFFKTRQLHPPKYKQLIPLGATGILKGKKYTVIAYAERHELGSSYYWVEYSLRGEEDDADVFLSTFNGHWMLLAPVANDNLIKEEAIGYQDTINKDGEIFDEYSRYKANYFSASGEFHWDVDFANDIKCIEYINPPQMIAVEYTKTETDIFFGEYIRPRAVSRAFLKGKAMSLRKGIGAAQPFYFNINPDRFLIGTLLFAILAFFIQYNYRDSSKSLPVLYENIEIDTSSAGRPLVSKSFVLKDKTSNIEVKISTNVDNNWCDADVNMVNEATGKEVDFEIGASFYHGYSEGESWSEGGSEGTEFLCSVPPGTYHFVVTPTKDVSGPPVRITLNATWDVPTIWNSVLLCIVLLVMWGILKLWSYYFEQARWA